MVTDMKKLSTTSRGNAELQTAHVLLAHIRAAHITCTQLLARLSIAWESQRPGRWPTWRRRQSAMVKPCTLATGVTVGS